MDSDRITELLKTLRSKPPRDYRAVLHYLSFLAKREIAASTARVTSGSELSPESIEKIRSRFSDKYGRSIAVATSADPDLLAGTRVQVGDDVYEISIPARLAGITDVR